MYYLMLAREYFIYHKQCHKHHKYMLYVLCAATASRRCLHGSGLCHCGPISCMFCVLLQLVAGVYMVVDYAIVGP